MTVAPGGQSLLGGGRTQLDDNGVKPFLQISIFLSELASNLV
jgi:hypothetical protein